MRLAIPCSHAYNAALYTAMTITIIQKILGHLPIACLIDREEQMVARIRSHGPLSHTNPIACLVTPKQVVVDNQSLKVIMHQDIISSQFRVAHGHTSALLPVAGTVVVCILDEWSKNMSYILHKN